MNVTMLLADSAQVADGKLYILGGGWSVTGPQPAPMAVAMKLEVSGTDLGREHHWALWLEDADGHPVMFETSQGILPIEISGDFTVATPENWPAGIAADLPLAVNFGHVPLPTGQRFVWRLLIDGETPSGGTVSFATRPAAN